MTTDRFQLLATTRLIPAPLQKGLFNAFMHMVRKNNRGSLNHPIDFMDLFEDVLVNEDLNKLRAKHQHYLLNIDVRTMVWLKHQQLLEIEHSPPAPKKNFY